MSENELRTVAISCGDTHGIGLEVILKTFSEAQMFSACKPVVFAPGKAFSAQRKALQVKDLKVARVEDASEAMPKVLNLIELEDSEEEVAIGTSTNGSALAAIASLEAATQCLASAKADLLVTAPIDKHAMQAAGFQFPGHTEFLANMAGTEDVLMILMSEELRVGTVTGHIPISDVPKAITIDKIVQKTLLFEAALQRDMGIVKPRIAILGLNPHAGDKGTLGEEDGKIITPAISRLRDKDVLAFGPYPADGFFGSSMIGQFDGVLAMYHDQGLVPFKALSFGRGVNYTAGLPIVRTSPDHGTAFDIAGQDKAEPSSFRHAVWTGLDIVAQRERYKEWTANPLPKSSVGRKDNR